MALWGGLGQAATVAQLVGVDAGGLISMHDHAGGGDGSAEQEGVRAARPPRLHDRRAAAAPAGSGGDAAAGDPEAAGRARRHAPGGPRACDFLSGEERDAPVGNGRSTG